MRPRTLVPLLLSALLAAGCSDDEPTGLNEQDPPPLSGDCALRLSTEEVHAGIDALLGDVASLEAAGTLTAEQASALREDLNGALAEFDAGRYCPTRDGLRAFRKQLQRFVSDGVLQDGQAEPMIGTVNRLLNDVPPELTVDAAVAPVVAELPGIDGGAPRPVARFANAEGQTVDFVANELYVVTDDQAALDAFLGRWNGTVLRTLDFSSIGAQDVAPIHLVRIDPSGAATDSLAARWSESAGLNGVSKVSSQGALELLAAALEETVDHDLKVGVNFLLEPADFADRTTTDAGSAVDAPYTYSPDAFTWPYMNRGGAQDIGTAEAWRVLDALGRLSNRVRIGVADGGFRPNRDFPAGWDIVPSGGLRVPNPDPSGCGSGSVSEECTWHGTHVALAAVGQANNGFGGAGPAGPVGDLVMLQSPSADFFAIIDYIVSSVPVALGSGPRIINISASVSLPSEMCLLAIVGVPACEILHGVTSAFRSAGILVVAAAGNDARDVDETKVFGFWPFEFVEEADIVVPCELTGVLCVGGLAWDANTKHGQSNYGSTGGGANTVRMFAPYEVWSVADAVAADESNATPDGRAGIVSGTSFSAPYVAGVAALVWAADPSLSANQVESILLSTAHTGSEDPRVPRWINALGAVQRAIDGNTPPWIHIAGPGDGATIPRGSTPVDLVADVEDLEGDELTVTWTSSLDGTLGTGASVRRFDLSVGSHRIAATASDGEFTTTSDSIWVHITNQPPVVEILGPADGTEFCTYETITFRADGRDYNNWPSYALPESAFSWSSAELGDLGTGRRVTAAFPTVGARYAVVDVADGDGGFSQARALVQVVDCGGNAPPEPIITKPAQDTTVWIEGSDGATGMWYADVALQGQADDAEDGALTGASLVWKSVRADLGTTVVLGTGTTLTARLYSEPCTGTEHTITLWATDSGGLVRPSEVRVVRLQNVC